MLPATTERVSANTAEAVNQRIRRETERRVGYFTDHRNEIAEHLRELDHEWDIERTLEANASTLAFAGIALGVTMGKRWLVLPAVVTAFLFQHALQGWCPPIPLLRRLGFRTASEIGEERRALMALRGDFAAVQNG